MTFHFVGYDIAQASDYSAISVIERSPVTPNFQLRYLERLPRKMAYPDQCKRVVALCDRIGRQYGALPSLAVDFTGVGAPVFDILKSSYTGVLIGVLITGGSTITQDENIYRIPKVNLISGLRVALESKNLVIARAMPEAKTLVDELGNFELKVSQDGHIRMEAGRGHDDLVLSTALALWLAEHIKPRRMEFEPKISDMQLAKIPTFFNDVVDYFDEGDIW